MKTAGRACGTVALILQKGFSVYFKRAGARPGQSRTIRHTCPKNPRTPT
jgi:hypothetical protein